MRRLPIVVVAAVVIAASCARTVNVEQEKAALLSLDAEFSKVAAAKNVDSFVSFFAPDGTFALSGAPAMKGPAAIRAAFEPMMKAPGFDVSWQATRAEVSASGDLGYTIGTYTLKTSMPSGIPVTEKGKFQTTWKKIDGAWKVIEDTGTSDAPPALVSKHVVVPASAVKWIDPPAIVPPGAKMAIISGDPGTPEPFTIRLQLPAGYTLPPHWHPTDEHVTVLSGTFSAGMGDAFDEKALADLPAGSYAVMSATMRHYARAKTATTLQVHGMGPFVVNYVNPADAPAAKK